MANRNSRETEVPLCERRLLTFNDFCIYSGLRRDKAREFIHQNNLMVVFGPHTICIDRKKFDEWCDNYGCASTDLQSPLQTECTNVSVHAMRRRARR